MIVKEYNSKFMEGDTRLLSGFSTIYESIEEAEANRQNVETYVELSTGKKIYYMFNKNNQKQYVLHVNDTYIDWRIAQQGDWCVTSDNGVVLCIRTFSLVNKRYPQHTQHFVKLNSGNFNIAGKYQSTYKSATSGTIAATNIEDAQSKEFKWKNWHAFFLQNFIIMLIGGYKREEAVVEALKMSWQHFRPALYENSSRFRAIYNGIVANIIKHENGRKVIQDIMGSKKLSEINKEHGLDEELLVQKTVHLINNLPGTSPNLISAIRLGKEFVEEAKRQDEKEKEENGIERVPGRIDTGDFEQAVIEKPLELPVQTETNPIIFTFQDEEDNGTKTTEPIQSVRKETESLHKFNLRKS